MVDVPTTNTSNAISFAQISESFSKYVVTPLNAFGLGGFVFDIEGETSNTLSAEITDHYLENNEAVQDHIAIKPLKVTLRSYVGELVYETDTTTNTILQKVVQKLTVLSQYLPILAKQAQQVQSSLRVGALNSNTIKQGLTSPILNNVIDLWAMTKNLNPAASKQQQAYLYFKALLEQKLLVSLQTPFEFVTNMAVEEVIATQDETTRSMCDFSITLKKIRVAATKVTRFDPSKYQSSGISGVGEQPRAAEQIQPVQEQGNNQGGEVSITSKDSPIYRLGQSAFDFVWGQ